MGMESLSAISGMRRRRILAGEAALLAHFFPGAGRELTRAPEKPLQDLGKRAG